MKQTNKFKLKVYQVVKNIPKGKILSYKEVAKLAGNEKAYRAVGNILKSAQNIPCHRVVRSDKKVGGYRGSFKRTKEKIEKLKKEGIKIKKGKIIGVADGIRTRNLRLHRPPL